MSRDGRFPFVAFDVETTGLHPVGDRILEVGAVRFGFDGMGETYESLVNPGRSIPPDATRLHGISDADVAGAPSFAALCGDLLAFLGGAILVAHHAPFDASFLLSECDRAGAAPPAIAALDSCTLSRIAFPDFPSHSLDELVTALAIERARGHRALPDAVASAELLLRSLRALGIRGEDDLPGFYAAAGGPVPLLALGFDPSPVLPPEYGPIADAIGRGEPLPIVYQDRFGKRSRRAVVPLRVVSAQGHLMLEAHCLLRGDTRCFRLDRIRLGG